jgi:spermidine synthase
MGEVIIDSGGVMLLDGDVIAMPYAESTCLRAASCVSGRVLEGGLGLGQTRAALTAAIAVASVETVEIQPAVIAEMSTSVLTQEGGEVVQGDVRAVVAEAAANGDRRWDSVLLDLGEETGVYDDPDFHADLRVLFQDFGARLVMVRQTNKAILPGWRLASVEQQEDLSYILIFDRYEPEQGIGTEDTRGLVNIAGYGWKNE